MVKRWTLVGANRRVGQGLLPLSRRVKRAHRDLERGMKFAICCDGAAWELEGPLKRFLMDEQIEVEDFGTRDGKPVLYPTVALAVAGTVAAGELPRASLRCGTGWLRSQLETRSADEVALIEACDPQVSGRAC
jgi:hypothetical protein